MGDSVLFDLIKPEAAVAAFHVDYSEYEIPEKIKKQYKISICTNVMNRVGDIRQTYIQNIEDNIKYPNVEFVLLNYGSTDYIDEYVKQNLLKFIDSGVLNYYKTTEPKYYSMTHSRNITFKVAQGDIVLNCDGDHFIYKFAEKINMLANVFPEKVCYCKSKHKNRGRLGFWKKEFIELLGGYDEDIKNYGFDDQDLLCRAARLGFKAVKFGKDHCSIVDGHSRHPSENYTENWRFSQRRNTLISLLNIKLGILKANENQHWGQAKLLKNFKTEINI